ncbi:MEDS domain-containing protein, partial [Staphylococcus aureus]
MLQIPALARTLRDNLRTNHRCTFYGSHSMVSAMSNWLKADGLELSQLISTGAVTITAERDYQVDGVFNGTKMISLLEESVEQALADGYAGV